MSTRKQRQGRKRVFQKFFTLFLENGLARNVCQLGECSLPFEKSWVQFPALFKWGMVEEVCSISTPEVEAGGEKFKVIVGYVVSVRKTGYMKLFETGRKSLSKI